MDKQEKSLQYSYGNTEYIISFIPFLIMGISIPLIILNVVVLLADFVTQEITIDNLGQLVGLIISLVFVLTICPTIVNQHNKVHVINGGLKVRVFLILYYRWIEVPWQEILGVEQSTRKDRWKKPIWVIKVKRLTFWHRYLSMMYKTGNQPVILVSSDMKNRDSLLDLVRKHTQPKL